MSVPSLAYCNICVDARRVHRFKIVVLPGDGIGPEVTGQALRVLETATSSISGVKISIESFDFGGIAIDNHSNPLPDVTLNACKEAHGILLGTNMHHLSLYSADVVTCFGIRRRWRSQMGRRDSSS